MDKEINIGALRARLNATLDDANLMAFIQDCFPEVIDHIGSGMGKADKLDELIDYCRLRKQLHILDDALDTYQPVPPIRRLAGANMDIDVATPPGVIAWQQDRCPWNQAEQTDEHRCATKSVSICRYFRGVEFLDWLLCSYPPSHKP